MSPEKYLSYQTVFPHIRSLDVKGRYIGIKHDLSFAKLLVDAGIAMWQYGRAIEGRPFLDLAENILNNLKCFDTALRAETETAIGLMDRDLGIEGAKSSKDRFSKALMIRRLDYRQRPDEVLLARCDVASSMLQIDDHASAIPLYVESLKSLERLGLETSKPYLHAVLLLGLSFCYLLRCHSDDLNEAEKLAEQALGSMQRARVTGPLYHRLIFGIACVLSHVGSHEKATDIYNSILRSELYENKSIFTVQVYFAQAMCFKRNGNGSEAK